jgi:hypothetical protein
MKVVLGLAAGALMLFQANAYAQDQAAGQQACDPGPGPHRGLPAREFPPGEPGLPRVHGELRPQHADPPREP